MKKLFLLLIVSTFFTACATSTSLFPNRLQGEYHGTQPAYTLKINGNELKIPAEKFTLTLNDNTIFLHSDQQDSKATYTVKAETKMYYSLSVTMENGTIEEWKLWKKGKRFIRTPVSPQPQTIFLKD